ncbi:OmpA family protein [Pseudogracilibacillus auburnensis]|uniref:OmpA family protein n=1 Tax=Pseudogracilibacillus auburnensis TaxID=1494959 RepID=UPI001A977842|nr:OmpA family protein [Pseudogracilibacillus auburnensis]MBO1004113.1 OmpA family protein [Pseudogracilibacillus auburnensis]
MKRTLILIFIFLMSTLLLSGCGSILKPFMGQAEKEPVETVDKEGEEEEEQEVKEEPKEAKEEFEEVEPEAEKEQEEEPIQTVKLGDYEVYIGGEVVEEDGKIIIHGESNLLPGARVVGEVLVGEEEESDFFSDTSEIVQDDGSFYMELAHHDSNQETQVSVKFHFDGQQDDNMIRHYGDRGQNLEGPYIYKHQGEVGGGKPQNIFKMAKVVTTFEPSGEKAIRHFKVANWNPTPDDMGDTRVWIEVDEINNDKEYFYLQGRSNLSEGANIFVHYGSWRQDETRVLPDGSFYLKIPYEYREDTNFVIEFNPNHWSQWNEIEERYGAEGQKLVGDLVVQDKYSDKQYIEKVVEEESQLIDIPANVELEVEGSEVTMLVPDNILFDYDKYDLKKEAQETLNEISQTLESAFNKKDLDILIIGHTDNTGSKEYNQELSKQRADEVKKHVEKQLKSKDMSITTEGYGDSKPIASNDTEEGQAKNRRVEIIINLADR